MYDRRIVISDVLEVGMQSPPEEEVSQHDLSRVLFSSCLGAISLLLSMVSEAGQMPYPPPSFQGGSVFPLLAQA